MDDENVRRGGVSFFVLLCLAVILYTKVPAFRDFVNSITAWTSDKSSDDIIKLVDTPVTVTTTGP